MKYYSGYDYQIAEDFSMQTKVRPTRAIKHRFFTLSKTGHLVLFIGFAWDGASGAKDTDSLMVPTAYHDVMYQMLRLGLLDRSWKEVIDREFKELYEARVDKISWWWPSRWWGEVRDDYIYLAVDKLGGSSTKAENIRAVYEVD